MISWVIKFSFRIQAQENSSTNDSSITKGVMDWYIKGKLEFISKRLQARLSHLQSKNSRLKDQKVIETWLKTLENSMISSIDLKSLAACKKTQFFCVYLKNLLRYSKLKDIKKRSEIMKNLTKLENKMMFQKTSLFPSAHSKNCKHKSKIKQSLYTSSNIKI